MDQSQQIAFNIQDLLREAELDAAPEWTGTPLHFHTVYATPEEHADAFARWQLEHGTFGSIPASHMWHPTLTHSPLEVRGHRLHMLTADTRPLAHGALRPGSLLYQANCPTCQWHHITDTENAAVEAAHDHAMPGWADLPLFPARLARPLAQGERKARTAALAWLTEHYPAAWQHDGAPIRTQRTPLGTRHVPGRSPFGGYDLAANPDA